MKGSRQVLVKVMLFQLRGCGHPQDDATPNFFADSKRPLLGLSNEVSFVSQFFLEGGLNSSVQIFMAHPVYNALTMMRFSTCAFSKDLFVFKGQCKQKMFETGMFVTPAQ